LALLARRTAVIAKTFCENFIEKYSRMLDISRYQLLRGSRLEGDRMSGKKKRASREAGSLGNNPLER
jgi:hypothetical protein